ncbi:MAG: iron-containing alcohol dehydrogenase [Anaerotignum sp.]|jgi:alcohol dehydrogenase|nr:iron-containing alcohol dehydrogenase [Anaerotignum sp.]
MDTMEKLYCRIFQGAFRMALPVLPYREPELLNRVDAIPPVLREKGVGRVLLVTDKGVRRAGLTRPLENALKAAGIGCAVYDGVEANPTIRNVGEAAALYCKSHAKGLIAFGGGSAMDCAKVTGARIACPKKPVYKMKGILKIRRKLPLLIAVPTTAGTGSETTLAAVITDSGTKHKYPINDFVLIPDYAVLDYRVTLGLPKQMTATTGMDALTHAVEAYIGRSTTRQTRRLCEEAVAIIYGFLKRSYDNGSDKAARAMMLRAAYCAGAAFSRSYVGYVHAVAHSLGGRYGVPHGLANAVILPYFLEEYGEHCERRLARLVKAAGMVPKEMPKRKAAAVFLQWVKDMNRYMGIPEYIHEIQEEDIPAMARHAAAEGNPLYPVPVLMNAEELSFMYEKIREKRDMNEN